MLWLLVGGMLALVLAAAIWNYSGMGEPASGSAWVEPTTGMQFVWVPSGCFDMGSDKDHDNEKPAHRVCVKGFYLGKYEVTQAEYEQVVGGNPCATKCNRFLGPDRAVTNVGWDDAQNMAEALSRSASYKFRLPSEAEWEYACRAGGLHKTYCGEGKIEEVAWIDRWSYGPSPNRPQTVGGKKPNAWGLFDMMGNVSEYVQDCWHGNYNGAPRDGSAWIADGYCFGRVVRGGSWHTSDSIKATKRSYRELDSNNSRLDNGFRLVKAP
jgi:formylglycine-generating enzyme required for sulfatase activity